MDKKKIIVFIIPPVLTAFMYPIFNSLAGALDNDRIAWYLGLITYWLIWGMAFPLAIIGNKDIKELIRPHRPTVKALFPALIAGSIVIEAVSEDLESKTFDTLMSAPVSRNHAFAAKVTAAVITAIAQVAL